MAAEQTVAAETTLTAREQRLLVNTLIARITRNIHVADYRSNLEAESAAARALGILSPRGQSDLAIIARSYQGPQQEFMRDQAFRLLMLTNWGFMHKFAKTQAGGKSLDFDLALAAGRTALAKAIASWDTNHERGGSFLNLLHIKFRGEISHIQQLEEHRPFRTKASNGLNVKVQMTAKKLEAAGVQVDAETVARVIRAEAEAKRLEGEEVDVDPTSLEITIAEIDGITEALELANLKVFSLDGEWINHRGDAGEEGVPTVKRSLGLADLNAETEATVVQQEFSKAIIDSIYDDGYGECGCCPGRGAGAPCANALTEIERFLVSVYHDIGGDGVGEVGQNELFDGVYESATGHWFSSEDSVINDREARLARDPFDQLGGIVTKMAQSDLTAGFDRGELTFVPGNDLSARVFDLLGKPPTQARVQAPLQGAYDKIRRRVVAGTPEIAEDFRSRGRNAIEHSGAAEQRVRAALIVLARQHGGALMPQGADPVSAAKIERMKAGRLTKEGAVNVKSDLRKYAEAYGLVDFHTGALKEDVIRHVLEPAASASVQPKRSTIIEQLEQQGVKQLVAAVDDEFVVLEVLGSGQCRVRGQVYDSLNVATRAIGGRDPGSFWQAGLGGEMVPVRSLVRKTEMQIGAVSMPPAVPVVRTAPKPQVSDIFDRGMIPDGKLIGAYKGVPCEAIYDRATGMYLVFSEGKQVGEADNPSSASKLVSKEENGYNFWAVERDGKRVKLRDLRTECAHMMLAEPAPAKDGRPQLSSLSSGSTSPAGDRPGAFPGRSI